MTQEEKQLLLKDLCARILYRPKGVKLNKFGDKDITVTGYTGRFVETVDDEIEVERVRLYLRPMSSMTEEEKLKLEDMEFEIAHLKFTTYAHECMILDYLYSRHLDVRGLIPMGLALEAPEGMYKIEYVN